jgi:hypothetical protein
MRLAAAFTLAAAISAQLPQVALAETPPAKRDASATVAPKGGGVRPLTRVREPRSP